MSVIVPLPISQQLEQSYERDSRWKPHLSWSFPSWTLQQKMKEQAAQRQLNWQKIADKLGPLMISDGAYTFGHGDYSTKSADERAYERVPIISHKQTNYSAKKEKQYHNITKASNSRFMTVSGILIFLIVLLFTIVILMALEIIPYSMHHRK